MPMRTTYTTVNGQILHQDKDGVGTHLIPDTLGNIIATMDDAGTVTSRTEYLPYGEVESQTGTNPTPFGFVGAWGYYNDGADMYVRRRSYSSSLSNWKQSDAYFPYWASYIYASSKPVDSFDPTSNAPLRNFGIPNRDLTFPEFLCAVLGFGCPKVCPGARYCAPYPKPRDIVDYTIDKMGTYGQYCGAKHGWVNDPPEGRPGMYHYDPDSGYSCYLGTTEPPEDGLSCLDKACKEHDHCLGGKVAFGASGAHCHCELAIRTALCMQTQNSGDDFARLVLMLSTFNGMCSAYQVRPGGAPIHDRIISTGQILPGQVTTIPLGRPIVG